MDLPIVLHNMLALISINVVTLSRNVESLWRGMVMDLAAAFVIVAADVMVDYMKDMKIRRCYIALIGLASSLPCMLALISINAGMI